MDRACYVLGTMVDSFQEIVHLVFMEIHEVDNDTIPILQIRILRHREVNQFAQDHPPDKRQIQILNLGHFSSEL